MPISEDTVTRALDAPTIGEATSPSGSELDDVLPERVGRYECGYPLGSGGMGVVFEAFDPELGRRVAIKRLRSRVLGRSPTEVETERRRLVRESRALASLSHPNVIAVYDVLDIADGFHIVMELVEGVTLQRWLDDRRPWPEVLEALQQGGRGLAAAHRVGLVHRDFKPGNVMVGEDGRVRVLDFGLARELGMQGSADGDSTGSLRSSSSSQRSREDSVDSGFVVGTPAYMAPEQMQGGALTSATDQFSYCVVLYEGLLGARPFQAPTMVERAAAIARGPGPMPADAKFPPRLYAVIVRGLSFDPAARFASMDELLRAIQRAVARRRTSLGVAAAGCLVVGAVAVALADPSPPSPAACEDGAAQVTALWNDTAREDVRRGLEASGRDYAESTVERVHAGLDAWAEGWTEASTQACATSPERLDRTSACLKRELLELRATVEALRTADVAVLDEATAMVAALPSPAACATDEPHIRPPSPEIGPKVEALRHGLARAHALERSGHIADARALLDALVERARALDYHPIRAELQAARARVLRMLGAFDEVGEAAQDAYFVALAEGDFLLATEAATTLSLALGDGQARLDDALEWAQHAQTALGRSSRPDPVKEAELLDAIGMVRLRKGERDAALEQFQAAQAVVERSEAPGRALRSTVLHNIGVVQQEQGKLELAQQTEQRALRLIQDDVGPDHPACGGSYNSMGNIYALRGDDARALPYYRDAVRVWSKGELQPYLGMAHYNVGRILQIQGDLDGARASYEEAVRVLELVVGPDHPNVAMPIHNLGELYLGQGRYTDARKAAQRALEVFEAAEVDPLFLAYGRFNLARALRAEGSASPRVAELAELARQGFVDAGSNGAGPLAELERWVADPTEI